MNDELFFDDSVVAADTEEIEELEETSAETAVFSCPDYTAVLSSVSDCLSIIVVVLLVWFASWLLRSWRTWIVKAR